MIGKMFCKIFFQELNPGTGYLKKFPDPILSKKV